MTASRVSPLKRIFFPFFNGLVFMILLSLVGYVISDLVTWALIGLLIGVAIGVAVELIFGAIGGWIYRRRIVIAVVVEIVLIVSFIGPFILFFVQTPAQVSDVCCIETSGLGDAVEEVRIPAADGVVLAGWYAPPTDGSDAVVMVLHGSRSNRLSSLAHAYVMQDAGYGVLVYDQRASGESTGDRQSVGLYDRRDIGPIIDWLSARPEVDAGRIGGIGLSLGAHILVSAGPTEPRLAAIWADGLGVSGRDDFPPSTGFSEALVTFINQQAYWMAELYLGERFLPFSASIPQIAPRHLMLVAGGLDPYEPIFNRQYEPLLGDNGELWVIEDAGHVGGLFVQPDVYRQRMVTFFDAALR